MSVVQEIMLRSTDYLRRIIAPVGGQGGVSMPLEDYVWCVCGGKSRKWRCAICGEKYDWKKPNRLLVAQVKVLIRPRSSERMQYLEACARM